MICVLIDSFFLVLALVSELIGGDRHLTSLRANIGRHKKIVSIKQFITEKTRKSNRVLRSKHRNPRAPYIFPRNGLSVLSGNFILSNTGKKDMRCYSQINERKKKLLQHIQHNIH